MTRAATILVALLLASCANLPVSPWTITPSAATLIVLDEADLIAEYQALGETGDNIAAFTVCALTPDELPAIYVRTDMVNAVVMGHELRHVRDCEDGKESWHD